MCTSPHAARAECHAAQLEDVALELKQQLEAAQAARASAEEAAAGTAARAAAAERQLRAMGLTPSTGGAPLRWAHPRGLGGMGGACWAARVRCQG